MKSLDNYNSTDASIKYLISFFCKDTKQFLINVLADDNNDPQYSCVTCVNNIWRITKCGFYLDNDYESVEDFLLKNDFSKQDFEHLKKSWAKEQPSYFSHIIGDCNREFDTITVNECIEYIIRWCKSEVCLKFEKCIGKSITEKEKRELIHLYNSLNDCLIMIQEKSFISLKEYLNENMLSELACQFCDD